MKADPSAQLRLLDVQELDSRADQLRHQRATLPEIAETSRLEQQRRELDDRMRDAQIAVDDLEVEQRKADRDVEQVKARRVRDRERMDQGLITNPKDLERMQHELTSLERRITALEDEELEVMEKSEEAQGTLRHLSAELDDVDQRLATVVAARDKRFAEIDASLAEVTSQRGPAAGDLPEDLVRLYERLREQKGGVGAAALRARQCGGCQLTLDFAELSTIKSAPAEEVIRCEECQRILVRTPESGL